MLQMADEDANLDQRLKQPAVFASINYYFLAQQQYQTSGEQSSGE